MPCLVSTLRPLSTPCLFWKTAVLATINDALGAGDAVAAYHCPSPSLGAWHEVGGGPETAAFGLGV
jgi:hypothetical protein